ncbi:hypothetical protein D5S17_05665 [Pseudonocardiaceae bacterium YIM PH 21723]|nr:hypothetical protein D5S17_05665 [Pseudonocardiaceae bacterium YIM PH 21723]
MTRRFTPAYGAVEDAAAGRLAIHLDRQSLAGCGQEIHISQRMEMGRHSVSRSTTLE